MKQVSTPYFDGHGLWCLGKPSLRYPEVDPGGPIPFEAAQKPQPHHRLVKAY